MVSSIRKRLFCTLTLLAVATTLVVAPSAWVGAAAERTAAIHTPALALATREIRGIAPLGKDDAHFGVMGQQPADRRESAQTPIVVRLRATKAPKLGEAINVTLDVHAYRAAPGTIATIELPAGAQLLGGATAATFDLAAHQTARLTASISFGQAGEQAIVGRALKTVNPDRIWGDSDALYLTVGQDAGAVGFRSAATPALRSGKASADRPNEKITGPAPEAGAAPAEASAAADPADAEANAAPETLVPPGPADQSTPADESGVTPQATVSLSICWTTNNGRDANGFLPFRDAYLQLWDNDVGADDLLNTTYTGYYNGCSTINRDNADVDEGGTIDAYFRVWTYHAGRWRVTTNADAIYSFATTTRNNVTANYNFGTWWMGGTGGGNDGATLIADDLYRAHRFITEQGRSTQYPGEVWVRFQGDSTEGNFYRTSDGKIRLTGQAGNNSRDVVVHEASHRFQHLMYAGFPPGDCPSPHFIDGASGRYCAWSEGWTYVMVAAVDGNPTYKFPSGSLINLETPTCSTAGFDDGPTVEGRVGGILIDLLDPFTLSFGTVSGFSNEAFVAACSGEDSTSGFFDAIWDTMYDQNDDLFVAQGGNTNSFSNEWEARQYPLYAPHRVGHLNSIITFTHD